VIGPRIEPWLLEAVAADVARGIDECLAAGTLIAHDDGWTFRHELTRRAVEDSIPAHRRGKLHEAVLVHLAAAGSKASPARLAHHAEMAGDGEAVVRYAREAGRSAAALRSHHEAAAQYRRALRFAGDLLPAEQAQLHQDLADELSLIDHWEESRDARAAALALWRDLADVPRIGDNLRLLGRAFWRLCQGAEAEQAAVEALSVLQSAPEGLELGWAYAHLGQVWADDSRNDEAIALSQRALELGERLAEPRLVSYALNTIGCVELAMGVDGWQHLEQALQIARDHDAEAEAGRAYANTYLIAVSHLRMTPYEWYHEEATRYCEEHDLGTFGVCLGGSRGVALQNLGRWDEAVALCRAALAGIASPFNRMYLLIPLATIQARRAAPDAAALLDEIWRQYPPGRPSSRARDSKPPGCRAPSMMSPRRSWVCTGPRATSWTSGTSAHSSCGCAAPASRETIRATCRSRSRARCGAITGGRPRCGVSSNARTKRRWRSRPRTPRGISGGPSRSSTRSAPRRPRPPSGAPCGSSASGRSREGRIPRRRPVPSG